MAAHHKCLKYIEEILELVELKGGKACQLGNCGLRKTAKKYFIQKYGREISKPGLYDYLEWCGFETTTIDIGGWAGSLPIDLSLPIKDDNLLGSFDLIVGFALIEHIEDQYELFRNIHNLCKVGGTIILSGPVVDTYKGHGAWKYDFGFFGDLFNACEYMSLDIRIASLGYYGVPKRQIIVYTSYNKVKDNRFIERENFKLPYYDPKGHRRDKERYGDLWYLKSKQK